MKRSRVELILLLGGVIHKDAEPRNWTQHSYTITLETVNNDIMSKHWQGEPSMIVRISSLDMLTSYYIHPLSIHQKKKKPSLKVEHV